MNKMKPIAVQEAPSTGHQVVRYNSIVFFILGGLQLAFGVICGILNVAGLAVTPIYPYGVEFAKFEVAHGIWAGAFVSR